MTRIPARRIVRIAFGTALVVVAGAAMAAGTARSPHWIGAWSASMLRVPAPANAVVDAQQAPQVAHRTLREIVRVGASGSQLRIVLDNRFGRVPVTIGAASVGRRDIGARLRAGTLRAMTFGGRRAVVLEPGKRVTSDPVAFAVHAGERIGVSLYVPDRAIVETWHPDPRNAQYLSGPGDRTGEQAMSDAVGLPGIAWLTRVDVRATAPAQAVVALGDSITNGFLASSGAAWTEVLQDRLDAAGCPRAVLNAGIDGNQVAAAQGTFGLGAAMRDRLDDDVLSVPGARYLLLLGGINDIGLPTIAAHAGGDATPGAAALAAPVIAAQKTILAAARSRGLRVYGATVLPFAGTVRTYTANGEAARQRVNAWIRTEAGFDGVIDFDRALRDPRHPDRLRPGYGSGDDLHPSDAGYRAMAATVPLHALGCR